MKLTAYMTHLKARLRAWAAPRGVAALSPSPLREVDESLLRAGIEATEQEVTESLRDGGVYDPSFKRVARAMGTLLRLEVLLDAVRGWNARVRAKKEILADAGARDALRELLGGNAGMVAWERKAQAARERLVGGATMETRPSPLTPAKAGTHASSRTEALDERKTVSPSSPRISLPAANVAWVPAFAGMSGSPEDKARRTPGIMIGGHRYRLAPLPRRAGVRRAVRTWDTRFRMPKSHFPRPIYVWPSELETPCRRRRETIPPARPLNDGLPVSMPHLKRVGEDRDTRGP